MSRARTKLDEAAYFLDRMRETAAEPDPFGFNLSAYLSAARSVTFHLQAEFTKIGGFAEWWEEQRDAMKLDARMRLLNEKRVDTVHIRPVAPEAHVEVEVHEVFTMVDALIVRIDEETGEVVDAGPPEPEPPPPPEPKEPRIEWRWYFEELPDVDVVTACGEQLRKLRGMVDECERRFE